MVPDERLYFGELSDLIVKICDVFVTLFLGVFKRFLIFSFFSIFVTKKCHIVTFFLKSVTPSKLRAMRVSGFV